MRRTIYFLLLFVHPFLVYGQRGYYVKDSTLTYGISLIDGDEKTNAKKCVIKNKSGNIEYGPEILEEYGFEDGRKYFSKVINICGVRKKVFLERLCSGKINLYYFKDDNGKMFFIEKNNEPLHEIRKYNSMYTNYSYRKEVKDFIIDCGYVDNALELFKFNKNSFKKIVNQYNKCERIRFPYTEFGVSCGYMLSEPLVFENSAINLEQSGFESSNSIVTSFLVDIPMFISNFSIHSEMIYQRNNYIYHKSDRFQVFDLSIYTEAISLPLLIRYKFNYHKLIPYVNAGAIFTYTLFSNNKIYSTQINNNVIIIDKIYNNSINFKNQFGISIGAGIQYKIGVRRSIFLEFRYNYLNGYKKESFGIRNAQVLTGFNF